MTDIDKAIDAAREALARYQAASDADGATTFQAYNCAAHLADLLAALDAARGQAVGEAGAMPGTGGFTMACFRAEDVPVGTKLYAAPAAERSEATSLAAAPLFLLHTGAIYGNERGDWEVEAESGKAVDAYCDANPGKTVGLYLATQAPPAAAVSDAALDAAVKGWTLDGGIGLRDALRGAIERAMLTQAPAAAAVQNREPRTGIASQCYDSAQLSTLPKWCRDLLAKAADALSEAPPASSGSCEGKATPCAAVPNRMPEVDPSEDQRAADYHNGWNDCRAAMLAAAERKGG